MTGREHRAQIKLCPTVAALAVGRELVPVLVQDGDGAEVDHARVWRAQRLQSAAGQPA